MRRNKWKNLGSIICREKMEKEEKGAEEKAKKQRSGMENFRDGWMAKHTQERTGNCQRFKAENKTDLEGKSGHKAGWTQNMADRHQWLLVLNFMLLSLGL